MIKQIFVKYFTNILLVLTLIGISVFGYSLWRDSKEDRRFKDLIGTKEKYEQLTKYVAKLESNYVDQKTLNKKMKEEFNEVILKKNERIKVLSDATYLIGKHVEKQNGPDYYYETPKATRNYILNELRIEGEESPAIGYILIKNDGRTYKRNYKFKIKVQNLQTIDEATGRIRIHSKAFFIQDEPSPLAKRKNGYLDWFGRKYPLPIIDGVAFIDPTSPNLVKKFMLWSPSLNANLSLTNNLEFLPGVDISLSGYGYSVRDLDWKFLHFGLLTNTDMDKVGAYFVPASYRFYPSVLKNTYFGIGIGNTNNNFYFMNLNIGF